MPTDDAARSRFLRDRVLTATPAQRVVMLYDRLGLDLTRASGTAEPHEYGQQLSHAMEVLAELRASLDLTAGGPADNLAAIYGYLLGELVAARNGETHRLAAAQGIVTSLRDAWAQAGELVGGTTASAAAGRWVG